MSADDGVKGAPAHGDDLPEFPGEDNGFLAHAAQQWHEAAETRLGPLLAVQTGNHAFSSPTRTADVTAEPECCHIDPVLHDRSVLRIDGNIRMDE